MKTHKQNISGFTLIELMIAMVIGLIILLGLVSLFTSSSSLNRSQSGLALLQENGRYAITRIKQDIELAGRKHCATVAMPSEFTTNWDQGYTMTSWQVDNGVTFTNGFPTLAQVEMDGNDANQLPGDGSLTGNSYPLDPRYFIQGFECDDSTCGPALTTVGADTLTAFPAMGVNDGDRAAGADILTVRYLKGGARVTEATSVVNPPLVTSTITLADPVLTSSNPALVADCGNSLVANASWSGNSVTLSSFTQPPVFNLLGDTRAYDMVTDLRNVSYFLGIDEDPSDPSRMISSLYRSENGNTQQIVEGVERFDVFYLAQLQTGRVARLTADQVQQVSDGGDFSTVGCIIPPSSPYLGGSDTLANGPGCLWRSIYAIEVHLLLNTVNNSTPSESEPFVYSPDGLTPQTPGSTLPSGLAPEKMYRREFTAIVPVRSYTL
ncbi:MAG: PilW family protein [Marinicella sp.]